MITDDGQRPLCAQRAHRRRQLPADLKRVGARQDPTDQDRHHRRASHHHRRQAARVTPTPNANHPGRGRRRPGQETGHRPLTIGPAKVAEGPIGGAKTEQNTGAEDPQNQRDQGPNDRHGFGPAPRQTRGQSVVGAGHGRRRQQHQRRVHRQDVMGQFGRHQFKEDETGCRPGHQETHRRRRPGLPQASHRRPQKQHRRPRHDRRQGQVVARPSAMGFAPAG